MSIGRSLHETARIVMDPSSGSYGCVVPAGVWHTVEVLEPSVIYESKDGKYGEDGSEAVWVLGWWWSMISSVNVGNVSESLSKSPGAISNYWVITKATRSPPRSVTSDTSSGNGDVVQTSCLIDIVSVTDRRLLPTAEVAWAGNVSRKRSADVQTFAREVGLSTKCGKNLDYTIIIHIFATDWNN